jgi:hypothetical protein
LLVGSILPRSVLDRTEDIPHLALKRSELKIDHAPPRVKNDIDRHPKRRKIFAHSLTHTPFDAVAINRLPHQSNPRTPRIHITQSSAVRPQPRTHSEEVRHLLGKLFPPGLIHPLIIGMFAKTKDNGASVHRSGLDLRAVEPHTTILAALTFHDVIDCHEMTRKRQKARADAAGSLRKY